jgi:hypothetical protein
MDTQPENFEQLRRLLALKRHEQPPPGYFDEFRAGILDRLQAGDVRRENTTERLRWEVPWLHRFLEALSAKPALTGVFGAVACAVVLSGVLYAERLNMPAVAQDDAAAPVMALSSTAPRLSPFNEPLAHESLVQPQTVSSTNPIVSGLFGAPDVDVQRVFGRPQLPIIGN